VLSKQNAIETVEEKRKKKKLRARVRMKEEIARVNFQYQRNAWIKTMINIKAHWVSR